jgi:hypothetical protein
MKTRSVAAERTLHGLLLSLGLWMTAVGKKRLCEVVGHAGMMKEVEIEIFWSSLFFSWYDEGCSGDWDRTLGGGRC